MAPQDQSSECSSQKAWKIDRIGQDYIKLLGQAEIDCGDMQFFADDYIEIFTDVKRVVAVGNVVFSQKDNRIAGDRADFNYGTKTGTFYNAAGIANRKAENKRANQLPVEPAPQRDVIGPGEPDVYFYGETIDKIGPEVYRVNKGGFTTCVQPTPRWRLTSGTVVVNLESYAFLTNSLFRVKGVPVLYLPLFYYPINKEDRASGFLVPGYGTSTIKGHTLSNAFFWAINRSQDATVMHDWFSNTGQGYGGEYRIVSSRRSRGDFTTYFLDEHESTFDDGTGNTVVQPARKSYEVHGNLIQTMGDHLLARSKVDYFSDITVQQTYHQNVFEASRRQRGLTAALTGNFGLYTVNGTVERREVFYGTTSSALTGGYPRVSASRAERPIFKTPIYFSIGGEFAELLRRNQSSTKIVDQGLNRFDFQPVIRYPFTKWAFLTANSTLAYRTTYWSESKVDNVQVEQPIWRRYFDMRSDIIGPVFNRIWNTPDNGYAEKFKHMIEPVFTIDRTTAIDNRDEIVFLDSVDSVVGNTTSFTYGINNRFYAKRAGNITDPRVERTPEILTVAIKQTYYTDPRAARVDGGYGSSFTGTQASTLSPVSLQVRGAPTVNVNGSLRLDYDTTYHAIRTISADGRFEHGGWVQAIVGWSQRRFIEELQGFNDPNRLDHYLNAFSMVHTPSDRVGGSYSFNYDFLHDRFLQQRYLIYYNAQCCGFGFEYQTYDFTGIKSRVAVPKDTRWNISFTLAGVGSFSNFFGSMGGGPHQ